MDSSLMLKGVRSDLIQSNNHMCEYFYWNDKRKKFYCECIGFMLPGKLCPVYICVACSKVDSCNLSPCDELCSIINDINI